MIFSFTAFAGGMIPSSHPTNQNNTSSQGSSSSNNTKEGSPIGTATYLTLSLGAAYTGIRVFKNKRKHKQSSADNQ